MENAGRLPCLPQRTQFSDVHLEITPATAMVLRIPLQLNHCEIQNDKAILPTSPTGKQLQEILFSFICSSENTGQRATQQFVKMHLITLMGDTVAAPDIFDSGCR